MMADKKKSFIAYCDWKATFDTLPDDKAGQLIKHIFAYVSDENPETDDLLINAVFANIKETLKRDLRKWEKQHSQRIDAGKKSAAVRKKNAATVERPLNDRSNSSTVNANATVIDNENDIVIKTKGGKQVFPELVYKCYDYCIECFESHLRPKDERTKIKWLETIDKLRRLDNIQYKKIIEIVKATRNNEFWKTHFMSMLKLRKTNKDGVKYIIVFLEQMNAGGSKKTANPNEWSKSYENSLKTPEEVQEYWKRIRANGWELVKTPTNTGFIKKWIKKGNNK